MSVRLNSGSTYMQIDLGAFAVNPLTTALTVCGWFKKIGSFVDYDTFVAAANAINDRGSSIETYNDNGGATRKFEAGLNSSGMGLGAPVLQPNEWTYVAFSRGSGGTISSGAFYCGNTVATLTEHINKAETHTVPFRYITIGDLAAHGLITAFNGEVAHLRVFAGANVLSNTEIKAEANSNVPVKTSDLLTGFSFDNTSYSDQGSHGFTPTVTGSVVNGASDPPPGPAGGGNTPVAKIKMYANGAFGANAFQQGVLPPGVVCRIFANNAVLSNTLSQNGGGKIRFLANGQLVVNNTIILP
jgi:hypothetical protein